MIACCIISAIVNSATSLYLGLFVYLKNRKSPINITFCLFALSVGFWSAAYFAWQMADTRDAALLWCRLLMVGAILIPVFYFHFATKLVEENRKWILLLGYALAALFLIINTTNLFVEGVSTKMGFKFWPDAGVLFPPFLLMFFSYVFYSWLLMFKGCRTFVGARKNQIKYVLIGTLIGFTGGSTNYPLWYDIPIPPIGNGLVAVYVGLVAYAIARYRLMDINMVIGKGIVYSVLVLAISGCYVLLVLVADQIFGQVIDYQHLLVNFFIFLSLVTLMIYTLPRLKSKAERVVERAIFKDKYSYRDILRDFVKRTSFIAKEKICGETVRSVANALDLKTAAIFVRGEMGEGYYIRAAVGLPEDLERSVIMEEENPLIEYLRSCKGTLILEELKREARPEEFSEIQKELERLEASLVIPINVENVLLGFLTLGERQAGEIFSHLDITLLETLCAQVGLALRYRQMEQRIGEADKLISLGTLAAGLAHEIRNPLVSIQTFAELLNEKYDDENFREEFSSIMMRDVKRITGIIESIMAFAGRQPAPRAPVKIEEVIDASYSMLKTEFDRAEVAFDKKYNRVPPVLGSYDQLMQLFVNLLLNAIQALDGQGGGRVEVSTGLSEREDMPDLVTVSVTDNGPGVDRYFLPKLFDPFVTTKATGGDRNKRGVGLGLSIVKRIVDSHNGSIVVNSEKGKGATFIIGFPVAGGEL